MLERRLGRTTHMLPALGLGCWAIGGVSWRDKRACGWEVDDDAESLRALQRGLDLGIQLLDTADVYGCGHSERLIAQAIAGRRDEVIIATKFGFPIDEQTRETTGRRWDAAYIEEACEASLRRLNIDVIDLYQFHLGDAVDAGPAVRDCLEGLVAAGKIRYYGWSTDRPEAARCFAEGEHCVAIQQTMNIFAGNKETLQICEKHQLSSLNRGPLFHGLLTGKYDKASDFATADFRNGWNLSAGDPGTCLDCLPDIRDVLTSDGRSLVQGALAWIWACSPQTIPIPGFKTVAQVEDNVGALEHGPLTTEQMEQIDRIIVENRETAQAGTE